MNKKKYISAAIALATVGSLATAVPAFADTVTATPTAQISTSSNAGWNGQARGMNGPGRKMGMMKPAVFGTVSAVSGTTLTVAGKQGFGTTATNVTYSVDASKATVTKNNASSTLSAVAVGDTVFVQGTVTGTSVSATTIRDGVIPRQGKMGMGQKNEADATTSPIQGNGQPVVAGTITAVTGSSVTITNKSNVQYTIDATNAKVTEGQKTTTVSSLTVGDSVIVQGTVNGNAITASSIIDQKAPSASSSGTKGPNPGFFGKIGQFFSHIFGF